MVLCRRQGILEEHRCCEGIHCRSKALRSVDTLVVWGVRRIADGRPLQWRGLAVRRTNSAALAGHWEGCHHSPLEYEASHFAAVTKICLGFLDCACVEAWKEAARFMMQKVRFGWLAPVWLRGELRLATRSWLAGWAEASGSSVFFFSVDA